MSLATGRTWKGTFEAFRNPHFRWLWVARLTASGVFQMAQLAQGWLVYELTGSALWLGWVSAGWSIAFLLLSLYGGVLADRVDKRQLMIWGRVVLALNTLVVAMLITGGYIRVWHLLASSVVSGVGFCFVVPAQQAMLAELVDRRMLLNAMALSSIGMGLMGMVAPVIAGLLAETIGVAGVYYLMVVLYILALFAVARLPHSLPEGSPSRSVWLDMKAGAGYILRHPVLPLVLILSMARVLLGEPYRTFMPKFAGEVMGMDAAGLGILLAAPSAGSLVASLAVASLGDFQRKGKLLMAGGVVLGLSLLLFSGVRMLPVVLFSLAVAGAMGNTCMVTSNTLVQVYSRREYRGRVLSVWMMMWGFGPVGTVPGGAVADRIGVPAVVALQGILLAAVYVGVGWVRPGLRRLR